jgi:hypothetical protein
MTSDHFPRVCKREWPILAILRSDSKHQERACCGADKNKPSRHGCPHISPRPVHLDNGQDSIDGYNRECLDEGSGPRSVRDAPITSRVIPTTAPYITIKCERFIAGLGAMSRTYL